MSSNGSQSSQRIALITSGTDGLGRATAILLAEYGHRVFAGGRSLEKVESYE